MFGFPYFIHYKIYTSFIIMLLKSYQRPGPTCWSNSKNNSHLLASASLQPNAQGNYDLSILSLDVLEKSKGLPVVGSASYKQPFRCIAWDTWGEKDGKPSAYSRNLSLGPNLWWYGRRFDYSLECQRHHF